MQWIESELNRRALVGLAAWLVFTSGAVGATGLGMTTFAMPKLVEAADESLSRSAAACPPCVNRYIAPGPASQSDSGEDTSNSRTWTHAIKTQHSAQRWSALD